MLVKKPVTFIKEICCFKFEEKYADDKIYHKFRDRYHYTGKYIGATH